MKTIFALFISAVGPTYDYTPVKSYADLVSCTHDAREWSRGGFHAYCDRKPADFVDGTVRPALRPWEPI